MFSAVLLSLCTASSAYALDPERAMSQYLRDRWTVDGGFPGGAVHAIIVLTSSGVGEGALPFDRLVGLVLGADAIAIALIGPGAFSVDARLFGRREILIPHDGRSP